VLRHEWASGRKTGRVLLMHHRADSLYFVLILPKSNAN